VRAISIVRAIASIILFALAARCHCKVANASPEEISNTKANSVSRQMQGLEAAVVSVWVDVREDIRRSTSHPLSLISALAQFSVIGKIT